jgi:hypothetical protein
MAEAPNFLAMYNQQRQAEALLNDPKLAENFMKGAQAGATLQRSAAIGQDMRHQEAREADRTRMSGLLFEDAMRKNALQSEMFKSDLEVARARNDSELIKAQQTKLEAEKAQRNMDYTAMINEALGGLSIVLDDPNVDPGEISAVPNPYPGRLPEPIWIDTKDKLVSQIENRTVFKERQKAADALTRANEQNKARAEAAMANWTSVFGNTKPPGNPYDASTAELMKLMADDERAKISSERVTDRMIEGIEARSKLTQPATATRSPAWVDDRIKVLTERAGALSKRMEMDIDDKELPKRLKAIEDELDTLTSPGQASAGKAAPKPSATGGEEEIITLVNRTTGQVAKGPRSQYERNKAQFKEKGWTAEEEVQEEVVPPSTSASQSQTNFVDAYEEMWRPSLRTLVPRE